MEAQPLVAVAPPTGTKAKGGACDDCYDTFAKGLLLLIVLAIPLSPVLSIAIHFGLFPVVLGTYALWGLAVGVPLLCVALMVFPVPVSNQGDPAISGGFTSMEVNGAVFNLSNWLLKLLDFNQKAAQPYNVGDWRGNLDQWFKDLATNDPMVGDTLGTNSKMYYSHATCKRLLQEMGPKIAAGTLVRESELALGVFNNLCFPEAGRFCLGFRNEDHEFTRPYLARMFGPGAWTAQQVRGLYRGFFANITEFESNNQTVKRVKADFLDPKNNKDILTQWTLKVIHTVSLGITLTDAEAKELSALQNLNTAGAGAFPLLARTFVFWTLFTGPTRTKRAKWIARYKDVLREKWPSEAWTERKLNLLASAIMDTVLFAGGRSVPLATDIVMGYILTPNSQKPKGLQGVDFAKEANLQALMMESMRHYAPVTTINYWERSGLGGAWEHHCPCLHKALMDPAEFPEPFEFRLNRPGQAAAGGPGSNSMAWADFAVVDGDPGHQDSHSCPGKDLSISMVTAFALEFQAAGFVCENEIVHDYYGTYGLTCRKKSSVKAQ